MKYSEYKLLIGSHVEMKSPHYLMGSLKLTESYGGNAMMFFAGAPQTTNRTKLEKLGIEDYLVALKNSSIKKENVFVHAPYLINLGSSSLQTRNFGLQFLVSEMERCAAMGVEWIILHPGAHLQQGHDIGNKLLVENLQLALEQTNHKVKICIETMSGKGTQLGWKLEHLADMIKKCKYPLYVCVDTCHIHDAGYDLDYFDKYLDDFDKLIGLDKLKVIHLNDSKNPVDSRNDRHENLGYGKIKWENLLNVTYHPKLEHVPKILETPWIKNETSAPYKDEISMLKNRQWKDFINPSDEKLF